MATPGSLSVEKLLKRVGTPGAPLIIDVRLQDDFEKDPRHVPTSQRRKHDAAHDLQLAPSKIPVVVVCQAGAKLSHGVAALLRLRGIDAMSLEGGFEAWRAAGGCLVPESKIVRHSQTGNMRWVTRHRPKIDRIACPWLIRRFVDPAAEFLFVPPEHVNGVADRFEAIPFDMAEGFWTHDGERCTFDKMLSEFGLTSDPLLHLARIVRAADTATLHTEPEAAGFLAVSLGLSRMFSDDLEQLDAGLLIYDALYRWCRDATDEQHNWPNPKKVPL